MVFWGVFGGLKRFVRIIWGVVVVLFCGFLRFFFRSALNDFLKCFFKLDCVL